MKEYIKFVIGIVLGIIIFLSGVFIGYLAIDKDPRPLGTTECSRIVDIYEEKSVSEEPLQSCYTCLGLVKGVDVFEKEMYEKEWLE